MTCKEGCANAMSCLFDNSWSNYCIYVEPLERLRVTVFHLWANAQVKPSDMSRWFTIILVGAKLVVRSYPLVFPVALKYPQLKCRDTPYESFKRWRGTVVAWLAFPFGVREIAGLILGRIFWLPVFIVYTFTPGNHSCNVCHWLGCACSYPSQFILYDRPPIRCYVT